MGLSELRQGMHVFAGRIANNLTSGSHDPGRACDFAEILQGLSDRCGRSATQNSNRIEVSAERPSWRDMLPRMLKWNQEVDVYQVTV